MQYFGGKARLAPHIAKFLNGRLRPGGVFIDAFCGSCNVSAAIRPDVERRANDAHPQLIALWRHVMVGGDLPREVSEELYAVLKAGHGLDWLRGFAGFGCAFAGDWFAGYARDRRGTRYADVARRGLFKKRDKLQGAAFTCGDYAAVEVPAGAVVYCDPPYAGTTGYSVGAFDHDRFYAWCRAVAKTAEVYVSEYANSVPPDARIVWSKVSAQCVRSADGSQRQTVEVIFTFNAIDAQDNKGHTSPTVNANGE